MIAAGGHGEAGAPAGDTLVAFALPGPASPAPRPGCRWLDQPGGRFELHAGMAGTVVLAVAVLWWRRRQATSAAGPSGWLLSETGTRGMGTDALGYRSRAR